MSDLTFFLLSLVCGFIARTAFIPAALIHKRGSFVLSFIFDTLFVILGGIPFGILVVVFHSGISTLYSLCAFNAGLLLPSLIKLLLPKKKAKPNKTVNPDKSC